MSAQTAGERAGRSLGPLAPVVLAIVETLPALLLALLLLPWIISGGSVEPWRPSTIDLEVYVAAVRDLLAGKDIYETRTPGWNLPFIYPPVAALLMLPLAAFPGAVLSVVWTALGIAAQWLVLRRSGVPRGVPMAVLGLVAVAAVEPIRTTLGYGQVNTVLMALVVADLLPVRDRRSRLPRGVLIGVAAAIKLTPALFVVFALLAGLRRTALWATVSAVGLTALGWLVLTEESVRFWTTVGAPSGGAVAGPAYPGNQSLRGPLARLGDEALASGRMGLAASLLACLLGVAAGVRLWRTGAPVLAVGLVGLATCLASPLAWTHHHVWVLPVAVALLLGARQPPLPLRLGLLGWAVWISLCPVLALLSYAPGAEQRYGPLQHLVANLGPLAGAVLLVAVAVTGARPTRSPARG